MDKLLYIATSGAKQDLLATSVRANNLANAETTGFKAQLEQARAMPAYGEGLPTRVFAMTESPTNNYESGPMIQTGNNMDMAIQGDGWFVVQDANGEIAYSRDGRMQLGPTGELRDSHGNAVMGSFGAVVLPQPIGQLDFAMDGTISAAPLGAPVQALEEVNRLLLVNPDTADLQRGQDGLYRLKSGEDAAFDPNVRMASGMFEGSNVNGVDEMVSMISLQRHYELQVKMMKRAEQLDTRGNTLLRII